jgi:hypothetical protein
MRKKWALASEIPPKLLHQEEIAMKVLKDWPWITLNRGIMLHLHDSFTVQPFYYNHQGTKIFCHN